jgi:hypothetical protein
MAYTSRDFDDVPRELKYLLLKESQALDLAVKNLGNAPLTLTEIDDLLLSQPYLTIFSCGSNGHADADYFTQTEPRGLFYSKLSLSFAYAEWEREARCVFYASNNVMDWVAVEKLVGSLDVKQIKYGEMVCTDLLSVHRVLLSRFTTLIPDKAKLLARKYTKQCLDNVVDYYAPAKEGNAVAGKMLPALLSYLAMQAYVMFGTKLSTYINRSTSRVTDQYYWATQEKCTILYHDLAQAIITM